MYVIILVLYPVSKQNNKYILRIEYLSRYFSSLEYSGGLYWYSRDVYCVLVPAYLIYYFPSY